MNTVTIFRGTLPKNFLGNVIYQFQLPCSCTALHIRLICHLQDRKEAAFLHEKEAEAAFWTIAEGFRTHRKRNGCWHR